MKSTHRYLLPVLALAVLSPTAWAEKEVTVRRLDKEGANHDIVIRKQGEPLEKEKVTFLGVETAPVSRTLAAQLGLGRDTGLVVVRVSEKSPAADILMEDDVLTEGEYLKLRQFLQSIRHKIPAEVYDQFHQKVERTYAASRV